MIARRTLLSALVALAVSSPQPAVASGPFRFETPFFDERSFEDLMDGHLTDRFHGLTRTPLISYLHLTGQFTPGHAALFRYERRELEAQRRTESPWRQKYDLQRLIERQGFPRPDFEWWKSVTRTEIKDGKTVITKHHIENCLPDAFRLARETLQARRSLYGPESPELRRWIEAQIKVFNHCGNQTFDPPQPPNEDWGSLEMHDRHYQIAASFFYDGQYLEARQRFEEIAAIPASPWSGLSRYLTGRSLVRAAKAEESNREAYLMQALEEFRRLAQEPAFLHEYPWIVEQVQYAEVQLDPVGLLNKLEKRIIQDPELASVEDVRNYVYLYSQDNSKRTGTGDNTDWLILASRRSGNAAIIARWREENSLEWLFLALITAGPGTGEETLRELLYSASQFGTDTPGYYVMLEHRVRLLALLGDTEAAHGLADRASLDSPPANLGRVNRVRLRAAEISTNWSDYFRFASMRPVQFPWGDIIVRGLPGVRNNRITSATRLFPREVTEVINEYFTPGMMLEAISIQSLSEYQRGRLAIAGWTKAVLMENSDMARELSGQVKRYVPRLRSAFEQYETGPDPQFEAALIVLNNPAFSPALWEGAGRIDEWNRPIFPGLDNVALSWNYYNWWCGRSITGRRIPSALYGPRFAEYSEAQLEEIRRLKDIDEISVAGFFGPFVLRYARSHLDDPRVPYALHRVVFATRYACMGGPGDISREAHNLLHKHFPQSDWAEKTPHWFD